MMLNTVHANKHASLLEENLKRISAILIYYSYEAFTKMSNGLMEKKIIKC